MTKKNYSKYEAKEEFGTPSFNHVLLHNKDTKCTKLFFNHYYVIGKTFRDREYDGSLYRKYHSNSLTVFLWIYACKTFET